MTTGDVRLTDIQHSAAVAAEARPLAAVREVAQRAKLSWRVASLLIVIASVALWAAVWRFLVFILG